MDFLNKFSEQQRSGDQHSQPQPPEAGGLFGQISGALGQHEQSGQQQSQGGGGLMGKLNSALGGGEAGEKKEGVLDIPQPQIFRLCLYPPIRWLGQRSSLISCYQIYIC